jgi:NAD(P)-dependent dehydrogenase (short-subunit alcohol dehydrogenase family)
MALDFSMFDLSGKVAIVTGSGRGLGKAMARGLAGAGAKVTISARTASEVEGTAAEFRSAGFDVLPIGFDATRRAECQRLVDATVKHFGRLDVMLANHGGGAYQAAEDVDDATWDRVIAQNLTSAFYCCQIAARRMIEQGRGGSIIVTSSTSSSVSFKGLLSYGAAKGGLDQMVRQMAHEWGRHNIRVNAINPGYTTHRHRTGYDPNSPAEQEVRYWTPLGRSGRPEEMAGPAVFLASEASSFVTGVCLAVDGGWLAV